MNEPDKIEQEWIKRYVTEEPFKPCAYYDPDGDCFEFMISNEAFYAKRLDNWVTVYYSQQTGEVVGSLTKDIQKLMRSFTALAVYVEGDEIDLVHVLVGPSCKSEDPVVVKAYWAVIEKAKECHFRVPVRKAA